jgi:hypothetical protein
MAPPLTFSLSLVWGRAARVAPYVRHGLSAVPDGQAGFAEPVLEGWLVDSTIAAVMPASLTVPAGES